MSEFEDESFILRKAGTEEFIAGSGTRTAGRLVGTGGRKQFEDTGGVKEAGGACIVDIETLVGPACFLFKLFHILAKAIVNLITSNVINMNSATRKDGNSVHALVELVFSSRVSLVKKFIRTCILWPFSLTSHFSGENTT